MKMMPIFIPVTPERFDPPVTDTGSSSSVTRYIMGWLLDMDRTHLPAI